MKMGKNDPRDSMSKSAKGSGNNGSQKGGPLGGYSSGEQCAVGEGKGDMPSGPKGGSRGRNLEADPVADGNGGKGISGKAEVS